MEKLCVKKTGTNVITVCQVIFYVASLVFLILGGTEDYDLKGTFYILFGGLLFLALLATPFKKIVKASEYYIAIIERENVVITEAGEEPLKNV